MKKKFYVTTPIYYVNDKPHIGHAYTTILADVLVRFHRVAGQEVFFLTGLDEHGQKVQQAAEARGLSPVDHCNDLAPRFLQLWDKLEIQYDDFIRTTQERHVKVVQAVLQKVYDAGDIYADEYEGWYSVSEERFITETEKESGEFRDVSKLKEKNWFFRMGKYQQQLLDYIKDHPDFIQPEHRKNEVLGFLRQPLGDLCISRPKSRMRWGIELPFDKDYVTYVWFDALLNYVTGVGYEQDAQRFGEWWPASVQLIGKDILTTHCVYWTTMLFSLGLPLPKTIFAHGWWLTGDTKMSKSLGNIVNPLDLIDQYGVDSVRYYLMREMVLGQDANFTMDSFIKRFNSDLANDFGNLLNRVSGLIGKYFDGCIPETEETEAEKEIREVAESLDDKVNALIDSLRVHEAIEEILVLVRMVNKYMEVQAPWKVAKEDLKRAGTILYTATEALRVSAVHLSPVMPEKTKAVLEVLGAVDSSSQWGGLTPGTKMQAHEALFPRLEVKD
ncbi:MAG: methionine--tRNA ligase [Candidatus Omnitrophica bacterium]|nr:methionine--tRNA ligase [Candidatus Omnitrophota bacterium]